ncbi:outer membrane protein [Providencia huaxiensis]|uniref:outer membrane protein n=1 Tax=Providencia huaxiensis TaxID=2027290 RepID=UPI0034E3FD9A
MASGNGFYVSGKLGTSILKLSDQKWSDEDGSNFAWSLGLGSQYAINDNLSLDLSYRFLDAGKSDVSYNADGETLKSKVKVRSNDIMFGVVYRF